MFSKGQVTIFFLVGIVLLISLLFVFYLASIQTPSTQPASDEVLRLSPQANTYLVSCMDVAFLDALETLTAKGGAFLDDRNDLKTFTSQEYVTFTRNEQTQNILYGIQASSEPITLVSQLGIENFKETEHLLRAQYAKGFRSELFGTITLPALCNPDVDGANNRNQQNYVACSDHAYRESSTQHSIQEALELFVFNAVTACMQRDNDGKIDAPLSKFGLLKTQVLFGMQTTTLELSFPQTTLPKLTKTYDIRLLALYDFTLQALVMNTRDPLNKLQNQTFIEQSPYFKTGFIMNVAQQTDASGNPFLLVTAIDTQSNIQGNPLLFTFAVQDRPAFVDTNGTFDPDVLDE